MTTRECPRCRTALPADAPEALCPRCLLHAGLPLEFASQASSTTGPTFQPPALADLAPLFPHLELQELIGQGGMGAVYKARQTKLDRLVALKVLPPAVAGAPGFAERFAREARALARLNHSHIVAIYDFGQVEGLYYLLMEYVDGVNLRQALAEGRLPAHQALPLVVEICTALQYAHEQGVVHRDVKPENILLDRKGHVKIADFGLAKLLGHTQSPDGLTVSRQVMGTPNYMAPEQQATPLEVDHRADIYSLGVVFYELLTGELPLGRFPPPSRKPGVDARLDGVVLRAMQREPQERYQHMSEMKTAVEAIGQGPPAPDPGVKALSSVRREVGITAALFAGLALVILIAVAAALHGYGSISQQTWFNVSLLVLIGVFAAMMFYPAQNPYLARLLAGCGLASGVSLTVYEWVGGEGGSLGCWLFPLWVVSMPWLSRIFYSTFQKDGLTAEEEKPVPGLAPVEEAVRQLLLRARKRFEFELSLGQTETSLSVLPDIDSDLLAAVRKTCGVPPDERVVGILDFSAFGETGEVVFGCRGLYYHNGKETEHAGCDSILYAELSKRSFVNHGKTVYLGNDQFLAPPADETSVDCEKLTRLLHEIQQLFASAPPPDKPGAKAEPS